MVYLEIFGAIFSIAGAIFMSKATKTDTVPLYHAFISFAISNMALFAFFLINGKVPIVIQMILFFTTAIIGIYKTSPKRKRDMMLVKIILGVYSLILGFYLLYTGIDTIDLEILPLDTVAALMAIVGSFLLSSKNHIKRSYAYILFLVADILFVYIGYTNAFYFFMIQSSIYIYTSSKGYYNTMKEEIHDFLDKKKNCCV